MLQKIVFFLIAVILPVCSHAQTLGQMEDNSVKDSVGLSQTDEENVVSGDQTGTSSENVVSEGVEEESAGNPVKLSPEEIIAFETEGKKSIRRGIKNKDINERRQLLNVFTWQEKNMKIKELIKEGKTYSEAKKIVEDMIKEPQINVKNNKDMERYIYKKGNFTISEEGNFVKNEK